MSEAVKKSKFTTKELVLTAMMVALMAVCSWISIPSTVPFTLQTFAVFCAVSLLGGRNSLFAVLAYLLIGAVGVPVFAGPSGGIGIILGTTGGYMLGFIFITLICWGAEKLPVRHISVRIAAMIIGIDVMYVFGTAWYILVYTDKTGAVTIGQALKWCVVPFVIPDLVKLVLAVVISERIKKYAGI